MNNFHTLSEREALRATDSSSSGLSEAEAKKRLELNGPNKIASGERKSLFKIFLAQFSDLMIWVLLAAAFVSAVAPVIAGGHVELTDSAIILIVVMLNAVLGTIQESKAEAALDALKEMAAPTAKVLRGGQITRIAASEIVVGDVVSLEAGDSVPADMRLIESNSVKIEESALTGESVPVDKLCVTLADEETTLGDRINMAYMGTAVTYGRGLGVVVNTGMNTQMGAIAGQLTGTAKEITPLQRKLNQISNTLSIGVMCVAAVIFGIGIIGGRGLLEMFMTAVSLAVAAIPEGMVAVVTIVLAMGMSRMAGLGAIIRRLPAVETLGSTQVICSDKTGTLTQNRMTVQRIWTETPERLYDAMGHCNDTQLADDERCIGDPTETALIEYLLTNKLWTKEKVRSRVREGEIPFDSERKLSTVAIKLPDGGQRIFVKGAADVLVSRCTSELMANGSTEKLTPARLLQIEKAVEEMSLNALRVLAYAYKDDNTKNLTVSAEQNLTFCGLTGMIDPARPEAKEAIALCRRAGILPVMITGDHKLTAVTIARDLGILSDGDGRISVTGAELEKMGDDEFDNTVEKIGVYARVAPEHKSRIVTAWQKKGKVVAMTGDGVNDAPALRKADIGVGMGITGTDVSKSASDMVLTDDNFASIVSAVHEGRRIFDNIHKTVRFLLSSNAGEVIAILTATMAGWTMLAPIHILWINLVTDTFPALALGVEPAEDDIMLRKPRDQKVPFFSGREWLRIGIVGAAEALLTIAAYLLGSGTSGLETAHQTGMTMAFLTLSLSQLFAAVAFQSERNSVFNIHPKKHPMLWLAFAGSVTLQLIVVLFPPLRNLFGLQMLSPLQWMQVTALCLVMLLFVEVQKFVAKIRKG